MWFCYSYIIQNYSCEEIYWMLVNILEFYQNCMMYINISKTFLSCHITTWLQNPEDQVLKIMGYLQTTLCSCMNNRMATSWTFSSEKRIYTVHMRMRIVNATTTTTDGNSDSYRLDDRGLIPSRDTVFFLSPLHLDWLWGLPTFVFNGYWELFPQGWRSWSVNPATSIRCQG